MVDCLVAAHPDDVLLGAYLLLLETKPRVIVLEKAGPQGTFSLAEELGYSAQWIPTDYTTVDGWLALVEQVQAIVADVLWLPSPLDAHPCHRLVSALAMVVQIPVGFYQVLPVDYHMGSTWFLTPAMFKRKKGLFVKHFPGEAEKYMPLVDRSGSRECYARGLPVSWAREKEKEDVWVGELTDEVYKSFE